MFNRFNVRTKRPATACLLLFSLPVALLALLWSLFLPMAKAAEVERFILGEETGSVQKKTPMPPEYCTPSETYIECETSVVDLPADGLAVQAMEEFYAETGVQPYLIVSDGFEVKTPTDEDPTAYYLNDRYLKLFGADEGHCLVLLLFDGETGDNIAYQLYLRTGDTAWEHVMYDGGEEILLDCIYAQFSSDAADETLAAAFNDAAEKVMTIDTSAPTLIYEDGNGGYWYSDDSFVYDPIPQSSGIDPEIVVQIFFSIIFIASACVIVYVKRKQKQEEAQRNIRREAQEKSHDERQYEDWAAQYLRDRKADAAPKRANYPITCPGCGATAYPNDDGTCQYCGRAIFDARVR